MMQQWYKCPQCNQDILYGTNPCPNCKCSLAWSQQGPTLYVPPIGASQQQVVQPSVEAPKQIKEKMTEEEAACQFVLIKLQEGIDFWATNYAAMRDSFGEKFKIQDEYMANLDLFLAKISLHIQSLKNLFPPEQADRIRRWILKYVESEPKEFGDYGINEIKEYEKVYNESVKLVENPVNAIATRLLYKWFGGYIADFDSELLGKKTGTIGPLQGLLLTSIVIEGFGWKIIKDNFDLVEG